MSICILTLQTSKVFNELILQRLEEKGFNDLSLSLLVIFPYLDEYKDISISKLAQKVGYTRQAMHKNLKKLEELGYITFEIKDNKKERVISFTEKSFNMMDISNKYIKELHKELEEFFGEKDLTMFKKTQENLFNFLSKKVED